MRVDETSCFCCKVLIHNVAHVCLRACMGMPFGFPKATQALDPSRFSAAHSMGMKTQRELPVLESAGPRMGGLSPVKRREPGRQLQLIASSTSDTK